LGTAVDVTLSAGGGASVCEPVFDADPKLATDPVGTALVSLLAPQPIKNAIDRRRIVTA
jgi:hypothetical protein